MTTSSVTTKLRQKKGNVFSLFVFLQRLFVFACTPNVTVKHNSLHKFPFAESKDLINEEKRKLKVLECSKRVSDEVLRK